MDHPASEKLTSSLWITRHLADQLLAIEEQGSLQLSLDLNRTQTVVTRQNDLLSVEGGRELPRHVLLERKLRPQHVYLYHDSQLELIELRGERYVKLFPTRDAPALVIDGISMHIARKDTPWRTTHAMACTVQPARKRILDTCGGLGYVALHAIAEGAVKVVSIERLAEVLELRQYNPWSVAITDEQRIEVIKGDVLEVIQQLPAESFDAVVHDPPRISRQTGDLYGRPFYRELFRVLCPGGMLMHYVGRPGITRGQLHAAGVPGRLQEVGFQLGGTQEAIGSLVVRRPR